MHVAYKSVSSYDNLLCSSVSNKYETVHSNVKEIAKLVPLTDIQLTIKLMEDQWWIQRLCFYRLPINRLEWFAILLQYLQRENGHYEF